MLLLAQHAIGKLLSVKVKSLQVSRQPSKSICLVLSEITWTTIKALFEKTV